MVEIVGLHTTNQTTKVKPKETKSRPVDPTPAPTLDHLLPVPCNTPDRDEESNKEDLGC
jgi:cell division protein FtsN